MKRYGAVMVLLLAGCAGVLVTPPAVDEPAPALLPSGANGVWVEAVEFDAAAQRVSVRIRNESGETLMFDDEALVEWRSNNNEQVSQLQENAAHHPPIQPVIELRANSTVVELRCAQNILSNNLMIPSGQTATRTFVVPEEIPFGKYDAVIRLELGDTVLARVPLTLTVKEKEPDAELSKLLRIEDVRFDVEKQLIKARVHNGLAQKVQLTDWPDFEDKSEGACVQKNLPSAEDELHVIIESKEPLPLPKCIARFVKDTEVPTGESAEWGWDVSGFPTGKHEVIVRFELNGKLAARVPLTLEVKDPPLIARD